VASWLTNVVSLAQFGIDVTALVNTESAVKKRTGNAAARNVALAVVMADNTNKGDVLQFSIFISAFLI